MIFNRTVFLVAHRIPGDTAIDAVCTSEKRAIDMCEDENQFYVELPINCELKTNFLMVYPNREPREVN